MLGLRGDVKGNKPIILMLSFVLFHLCPFVMRTFFFNYSLNLLHNNKTTSSAENRYGCCLVQYILSSVPKTLCNNQLPMLKFW